MLKKYNFKIIEKNKYEDWIKFFFSSNDNDKIFNNKIDSFIDRKNFFSLIMPPPNITGQLHLGHALNGILNDVLIRKNKLMKKKVFIATGFDHAGIKTQIKIEKKLNIYNRNNNLFKNKKKFFKFANCEKIKFSNIIYEQWKKLGIIIDNNNIFYTLDKKSNYVVNEVFKKFYKNNLIFKDYHISNWDIKIKKQLSDSEVTYKKVNSKLFTISYKIKEINKIINISTTRPETIFSDVAIVVHPKDKRYKRYLGFHAINPLNNKLLPIISDFSVNMEFGTGAVKCSPAHDKKDFLIGKKNNFKMPVCIDKKGKINVINSKFYKMDRFLARKKIINYFNKIGILKSVKIIKNKIAYSKITFSIIDSFLTKQWFLDIKTLSKHFLNSKNNKNIIFYPKKAKKIFFDWVKKTDNWCISRQLWWGHNIPIYYNKKKKKYFFIDNKKIKKINQNLIQENSVLDTWFSSSLWPLITLNWFKKKNDYNNFFYPINILVCGYDIIFFWIMRMIIIANYFTKTIPFKKILIHGLIRDKKGLKMSKTLNNSINPNIIIKKYGADVLRLYLISNLVSMNDFVFSKKKIKFSKNFINKLWNLSYFIKINFNLNFKKYNCYDFKKKKKFNFDEYILLKFNKILKKFNYFFNNFNFRDSINILVNFIWHDFCDYYIEFSKIILKNKNEKQKNKNKILFILKYIIKKILILLHPFIPFVTEEIFFNIFKKKIFFEKWPKKISLIKNKNINKNFKDIIFVKNIIFEIRKIRALNNILLNKKLSIYSNFFNDYKKNKNKEKIKIILEKFLNLKIVDFKNKNFLFSFKIDNKKIFLLKNEILNKNIIKKKLLEKKKKIIFEFNRSKKIISNKNFLNNAPIKILNKEKKKFFLYKKRLKNIILELNKYL